jgi:hypothetical protein
LLISEQLLPLAYALFERSDDDSQVINDHLFRRY